MYQLPGIKGVQQVNISGSPVKNLQRQIVVFYVDLGWNLVGIAPVTQDNFLPHFYSSLLLLYLTGS
jgi:hypothetical protein